MKPSAFVFDAYGTLFDITAAARRAASDDASGKLSKVWPKLAEDWRRKQLEYTWLRSIMQCHADFAEVTANSLDWAMEAQGLGADHALRQKLLSLYDELDAFPEVAVVLTHLRETGVPLAILSNGTPKMLQSAIDHAGIGDLLTVTLSVEMVGIYKPSVQVYAMVERQLNVPPAKVLFVSSNGWDVAGAAHFGFQTAWVNRGNVPLDRLPHVPRHILKDLTPLPDLMK